MLSPTIRTEVAFNYGYYGSAHIGPAVRRSVRSFDLRAEGPVLRTGPDLRFVVAGAGLKPATFGL